MTSNNTNYFEFILSLIFKSHDKFKNSKTAFTYMSKSDPSRSPWARKVCLFWAPEEQPNLKSPYSELWSSPYSELYAYLILNFVLLLPNGVNIISVLFSTLNFKLKKNWIPNYFQQNLLISCNTIDMKLLKTKMRHTLIITLKNIHLCY